MSTDSPTAILYTAILYRGAIKPTPDGRVQWYVNVRRTYDNGVVVGYDGEGIPVFAADAAEVPTTAAQAVLTERWGLTLANGWSRNPREIFDGDLWESPGLIPNAPRPQPVTGPDSMLVDYARLYVAAAVQELERVTNHLMSVDKDGIACARRRIDYAIANLQSATIELREAQRAGAGKSQGSGS